MTDGEIGADEVAAAEVVADAEVVAGAEEVVAAGTVVVVEVPQPTRSKDMTRRSVTIDNNVFKLSTSYNFPNSVAILFAYNVHLIPLFYTKVKHLNYMIENVINPC